MAIPSQARREISREGVETRRAAPKPRVTPGEGEGIVQTANRKRRLRPKLHPGGESRRRHRKSAGLKKPVRVRLPPPAPCFQQLADLVRWSHPSDSKKYRFRRGGPVSGVYDLSRKLQRGGGFWNNNDCGNQELKKAIPNNRSEARQRKSPSRQLNSSENSRLLRKRPPPVASTGIEVEVFANR